MREKLLLFSGFILLSGSTHLDVLVPLSVPHPTQSASIQQTWSASLISNGLIRELEQPVAITKREYIHSSTTREMKKNYDLIAYRLRKAQAIKKVAVAPAPQVATLHPVVDKEDIHYNHRVIADQVLRLMPKRCVPVLQNFYVRYDNPEHRGLGGKSTMILTGNVSDQEFRALFVHEFGHLMDLGCLVGSPAAGRTAFLDNKEQIWKNDPSVKFYELSWTNAKLHRKGITDEDFVSGYAAWDPFEDFSESFAYYILHREVFAKRATKSSVLAAKYLWFQQNLPNMPMVATSNAKRDSSVPWDITKLAYDWHPPANLVARR